MSHALVSMMRETLAVLEAVNCALDGDEPDAESEARLEALMGDIISKFRDFADRHAARPTINSASKQTLARLAQLRREVERKNERLEKLRLGLKTFELEMSLRGGGAGRAEENNKRFRLDEQISKEVVPK